MNIRFPTGRHKDVLGELLDIYRADAEVLGAVINGLIAPPLMILIVLLGSDRTVMKDNVNGPLSRTFTWIATACMSVAATALVVTTVPM